MYRQKFKYEFGPMIFLWRLKFQRDFVFKFFGKNECLLFKNGPEFFSFSLAIFIFVRLLQKKIIPETKFTQQSYFQNVKLE